MAQNQQNNVRIDITASGKSPREINALTALLARTLQQHLPEQTIQVSGQDQQLQTSLESMDLNDVQNFDFGQILLVADQNKQFEDPSLNKDLKSFDMPRTQASDRSRAGQTQQMGRGH